MEGIRIFCENTSSYEKVSIGTTLSELYVRMNQNKPMLDEPVLAALVDNKLKSLDYKIINPHNVRFIDYGHPDGRRTYIRSLCFVLQKVVREMFPEKVLVIDYSLPSGLYCEIREVRPMEDGRPCVYFVTDDEIETIEERIDHLLLLRDIQADKPEGARGFTAFIPWIFCSTGTRLEEEGVVSLRMGLQMLDPDCYGWLVGADGHGGLRALEVPGDRSRGVGDEPDARGLVVDPRR